MKHKHYDCIVAWASGEKIEIFKDGRWILCADNTGSCPSFSGYYEYRIKKEPVIEVKYFELLETSQHEFLNFNYIEIEPKKNEWHLKITYQDGKAIKAEVAE